MDPGSPTAGADAQAYRARASQAATDTALPYPARIHVQVGERRASSSSPPQSSRFRTSRESAGEPGPRHRRHSSVEAVDLAVNDVDAARADASFEEWTQEPQPQRTARRSRAVPTGSILAAGRVDAANAALLADLRRDSYHLAESVTGLFASLRESLGRSTECTRQHLELYRDTSASVAAETREVVDSATAFVTACVQLSNEVETLEHIAAQTRQVCANLDALEAAANKVLPPSSASGTSTGLFSRGGT